MTTKAEKPPLTVSVTVQLPKTLHKKLADIAAQEGVTLNHKLVQAARQHAAHYTREQATVTKHITVTKYVRKK